jgi:uncharacterized membrane protein
VRRRPEGEDGTILLLTLGYVVVVLALVAVVVDVSAVFLARRALASDCDGAALAAAQSVDTAVLYRQSSPTAQLPLTGVQEAVAGYPVAEGVVLQAMLVNGSDVRVSGRRTVQLPLVRFLGIGSVNVVASATAHTQRTTG